MGFARNSIWKEFARNGGGICKGGLCKECGLCCVYHSFIGGSANFLDNVSERIFDISQYLTKMWTRVWCVFFSDSQCRNESLVPVVFVTDMVYLLACRLHIAQLTLFHTYHEP